MSHGPNITAATGTCPALAPELAQWVQSLAIKYGIPQQRFIDGFREMYGEEDSVLKAKTAIEETERILRENSPFPPEFPAIDVGKPSPNERIITGEIGNNIKIRMWGSRLHDSRVFLFDFTDGQGNHIRMPPGMKIFTDAVHPGDSVLSIEQSIGAIPPHARPTFHQGITDHTWETFIVPEGIKLRIEQPGRPDLCVAVPWHPEDGQLVVMEEH
ncbi:hypothetical protein BD779DRAFT_1478712 [Infundibulicybe gibba]|nr:hypothetical protein BD779DRAFT_1478712 [Infundibulicybe gibba]